ncbi:MAG TPA: hypothetical protein VF179_12750 [Thermoanaerobaculia bacterium]|nr:hypothetical protein [Thermoanaerobaculia bacterium]
MDWKETRLWKQIEFHRGSECNQIRALLELRMPMVQRILASGVTSSTDFTLHDAGHSFRVAEQMCEIISPEVLESLSEYELALLLLSAYLHDIGMTPQQMKIQRHWNYLVFGPASAKPELTESESTKFQAWLDMNGSGIYPPLANEGNIGREGFLLASKIITSYARDCHNDWSKEWIKVHLSNDHLGSYEDWINDLVHLCRSHHYGYEEISSPRFDPRPAGRSNTIVHLRYLACVLRVADILDVDPERTPSVILEHRSVSPESLIYWWKDHNLSIHRDGAVLVIRARPRDALIENAIRTTADSIRQELELCGHLSREKPFSVCPFLRSAPLPHKWTFPESVLLQVRAWEDSYVYIDGAFRPDTAKLLELLSGIRLYGDTLAAVRELIQNAFDAVRELMAAERLKWDNPNDPDRMKALESLQRIDLSIEERDGRTWLTCSDTGAGMNRVIIERYLLVSGRTRRTDIINLERLCQEAGFSLSRTGCFGIGVLSYFMLADRVEFRTRRHPVRGDAEPHGWYFVTEGVGSFGELRRDIEAEPGTTVRFRLRPDYDGKQLGKQLSRFVAEHFMKRPCMLSVHHIESQLGVRLDAGWDPQRLSKQSAEDDMRGFRWYVEESLLPDSLGEYRISIPYFELPSGIVAGLLQQVDDLYGSGRVEIKIPFFSLVAGLHGVKVESDISRREELNFLVQVDWTERAGTLSVSRNYLSLSQAAKDALREIEARGEYLQAKLFSERSSSPYSEINFRIYPGTAAPAEPWWPLVQDGVLRWEQIKFPVAATRDSRAVLGRLFWQGEPVSILPPVQIYGRRRFQTDWTARSGVIPDVIGVLGGASVELLPLCLRPKRRFAAEDYALCAFPPSWTFLCAYVDGENGLLWNDAHPLAANGEPARAISEYITHIANVFHEEGSPDAERFKHLRLPEELLSFDRGNSSSHPVLGFWIQTFRAGFLVTLTRRGVEFISNDHPIISQFLSLPDGDWTFKVEA